MLTRATNIDQWPILFNTLLNKWLKILRIESLDDSFKYFLVECEKRLGCVLLQDSFIRLNIRILSF